MTEPLERPKRKNPLVRSRSPLLPPSARSRAAHWLTLAAAEGRFALPTCLECGSIQYPARDLCPACLSIRLGLKDVSPLGTLAVITIIHTSTDVYFRERTPWRIGTVFLDAGPSVVAHVHGDCIEGQRVRLAFMLDKSGQVVAFCLPERETPNMADDPQLRELTLDPKYRRVLITDGRSDVGQAAAKAFADAGASIIFIGYADAWKPFPAVDWLKQIHGAELMPLDLTDSDSIAELSGEIGSKVDILVNTADHIRPGGLLDRSGVTIAREEMELGYFGLMRLAQAFGPIMRARGADGANSACAWVNVLSVYAHMNWPAYGAHCAAQAAMLSAAQSLRAELRIGGVRVVNVFTGPIDSDWFQPIQPPKVAPSQIANAMIDALRRGLEDVYVGDIAQDVRARLAANPKALERELGT
jgi:NAD(P)-dependent dehydrogenase (short-subunit alcohol dehydrogenase family)/uncharacterized OB-fold protein